MLGTGPDLHRRVEDLMEDLKEDYTIVIVTHNMQQARRVSDMTACLMLTRRRPTAIAPASSPNSAPRTSSSPTPKTSAPRRTSPAGSVELVAEMPMIDCTPGEPDLHAAALLPLPSPGPAPARPKASWLPRLIPTAGFIAAPTCKSTDRLTTHGAFRRAKRSGYTGILYSDYKLQVLDRVTDNYFRNVKTSSRPPRRRASSWCPRSSRSATATATCP